jgi:protein ImuA
MPSRANLAAIRAQIAAVEAGTRTPSRAWRFGIEAVDGCFRGGGLPLGTWHEVVADGMEAELCAAPAAFAAQIVRALCERDGEVVWVMRRDDLYPPGLSGLGLAAERLIQVRAESEEEVLAVVEEALSTRGVAAVVGEAEEVPLVAGRRLQLACERGGATGFVLARRPWGIASRRGRTEGSAAASRWKIAPAPGAAGPGGLGYQNLGCLGTARWSVELARCRGGRSGAWIFEEAGHGPHPFRLAAEVADHRVAEEPERGRRSA